MFWKTILKDIDSFENLDHLVSLKEYIEIIHAAETISKNMIYILYFHPA